MSQKNPFRLFVLGALMLSLTSGLAFAQRGNGPPAGRGHGRRGDANFKADRDVLHFLLANHQKVKRTVKNIADGVETITESDDKQVAGKIKVHVAAMYTRVEKNRPIRLRDPLFAELFKHTDKIDMKVEHTKKGVRVKETSSDPYVARLIQEHAKVVSKFVKHGHTEARKNHAVPTDVQIAVKASKVAECDDKCSKPLVCCKAKATCACEKKTEDKAAPAADKDIDTQS